MGLLSSDQIAAIGSAAAKVRYRQVWAVGVPDEAGGDLTWTTIHDDANGPRSVLDPGERETEAYNQTLAVAGKLPTGLYRFVVDNSDGMFYLSTSDNYWYNQSTAYQADPIECYIEHSVYVLLANGTWSLLDMIGYIGIVTGAQYDNEKQTATIETKSRIMNIVNGAWNVADGDFIETGVELGGS